MQHTKNPDSIAEMEGFVLIMPTIIPLVSCPALLLTTSSLARTPSPGPPRLKNTPAAVRPLPQGGEGQGSEGVLSAIRWDRTLVNQKPPSLKLDETMAWYSETCNPISPG
jgi:hypothetical protein